MLGWVARVIAADSSPRCAGVPRRRGTPVPRQPAPGSGEASARSVVQNRLASVGPEGLRERSVQVTATESLGGPLHNATLHKTHGIPIIDPYLHTAAVAMDRLFPGERHRRPRILPPATRLAATLFRYLDSGGHYPEAITIHSQARLAARHMGDPAAEALTSLGVLDLRQGCHPQAAAHLQQGLALFREIGDQAGEARALRAGARPQRPRSHLPRGRRPRPGPPPLEGSPYPLHQPRRPRDRSGPHSPRHHR